MCAEPLQGSGITQGWGWRRIQTQPAPTWLLVLEQTPQGQASDCTQKVGKGWEQGATMDPLCVQLLQEDFPGQCWSSATQILVTADKQELNRNRGCYLQPQIDFLPAREFITSRVLMSAGEKKNWQPKFNFILLQIFPWFPPVLHVILVDLWKLRSHRAMEIKTTKINFIVFILQSNMHILRTQKLI